jgi:hypothetical protein
VDASELVCHLVHPERDQEDPELIRTEQYFFPSSLSELARRHKSSPLKTASVPTTASPTRRRVTINPDVRIQERSTLRRHQKNQREAIQETPTVEMVMEEEEVEKDFGPRIEKVPANEPVNMFDLNSNDEEADQVTEVNLQPSTENDSVELLL